MANLIPPHVVTAVRHEYRMRVATVWSMLFVAVGVIAFMLFVPVYVVIEMQHAALQSQIRSVAADMDTFTDNQALLTQANELSEYIQAETHEPMLPIIETVSTLGSSVSLGTIAIKRAATSSHITIDGVAVSRDDLIEFRDALRESSQFHNVRLPIENLVGEDELPFTIRADVLIEYE